MKALVIGATGATGTALVHQLLADDEYHSVVVFVRKPLTITHPKLSVCVVDFDNISAWQEQVRGDVLYSCLGTTQKQAGTRQAFHAIDFGYQYHIAKVAHHNQVPRYVLISADWANQHSLSFYLKTKGELEQAVSELGFHQCVIMRPPLLKRPNSDRFGEKVGEWVLGRLSRLPVQFLQSQKPLGVDSLAFAMRQAVALGKTGVIDKDEIWQMVS